MPKIAHKLVAKTANEIAREVYEALATSNNFFRAYPTMHSFTSKHWSYFIGDARKALTMMLKPDPITGEFRYSEHVRDEIFEALCLEGELKGTPGNNAVQPF